MTYTVSLMAWASFFLAIASYICGSIAILSGSSQPSVISRFFWLVLSVTNFLSYLSLGAGSGIFLSLANGLGSAIIFILSIKHGYIEFKRADFVAIGGASIALMCYLLINIKLVALVAGLLTHFISGLPTYKRTWQNPHSENLAFWVLFALASFISFTGVLIQHKNMIYPLYFFLFDAAMALLIFCKRKQLEGLVTNPHAIAGVALD